MRSFADARLLIEEGFEHNFKPERDLLDYLAYKQGIIYDKKKLSTQVSYGLKQKLINQGTHE